MIPGCQVCLETDGILYPNLDLINLEINVQMNLEITVQINLEITVQINLKTTIQINLANPNPVGLINRRLDQPRNQHPN